MSSSTSCLYLTADAIGSETGGGVVTRHEARALVEMGVGDVLLWSFPKESRPWGADDAACARLEDQPGYAPRLVHCYSGTFSKTIALLKARGTMVTYTAAAHSIEVSREEHEALGVPFDYPHLTDAEQWSRYIAGYRMADLVICPSSYSMEIMRGYGCRKVHVIPHGVSPPMRPVALPARFSVAYLGQAGPDKGIRHLLAAWEILGFQDALLTIAGRGTEHLLPLVRAGSGSVFLRGAVEATSEIYDACALYVQPSASEGFGISVLEAMAHGRPAACSAGAGAAELATFEFAARDPESMAVTIAAARDTFDRHPADYAAVAAAARERALGFTWDLIRSRYCELWRSLT